jgi:hypothetical protein
MLSFLLGLHSGIYTMWVGPGFAQGHRECGEEEIRGGVLGSLYEETPISIGLVQRTTVEKPPFRY